MLTRRFPKFSTKNSWFSIILIVNTFVWLLCTSAVLDQIIQTANFSEQEVYIIWTTNFFGAAISIVLGAYIASKFRQRKHFLLAWIFFGIFGSLVPWFVTVTSIGGTLTVSILFSISFGLGLPAAMAEFSDNTNVESRAKLGGLTWLLIMVSGVLVASLISENLMINSLIVACWRGFGLTAFLFSKSIEREKKVAVSFMSVLRERSVALYVIPWTMFSLVNYLSAPVGVNFYGEEFVSFSMFIGNLFTGIFAIVGGLLSDVIGRKRITILGFIMLGLGYAILGIYPQSISCWYFYVIVDGIAWGIFYVIFFFTVWGDLAYGKSSEKYYALGSLPYLLSSYLRLVFGPFIANNVSAYAIFSFAAFFLFLAVVPLMYAPETLPEQKIRDRELREYIEKAKKIKEKHV